MTEIPEIEETGSTGEQEATSGELIPPDQETPFPLLPIAESFRGLAATRARSFGGEIGATLASAVVTQISNELSEAKLELRTIREKLELTRIELSSCQTKEAVLRERVSSSVRIRHLRSFTIIGGSLLFPAAIELNKNSLEFLSFVVGGIGLLLILVGWLWPTSEPNE